MLTQSFLATSTAFLKMKGNLFTDSLFCLELHKQKYNHKEFEKAWAQRVVTLGKDKFENFLCPRIGRRTGAPEQKKQTRTVKIFKIVKKITLFETERPLSFITVYNTNN